MSLGQHLIELRKRLFLAALGILLGAVAGWFLAGFVLDGLRAPIEAVAGGRHGLAALNYDGITTAFDLKLQIAFTLGVIIASPIWLYQAWAFLVPGLNRKELGYSLGFFFTAVPLFLAGCAAGWFVLPHIVSLLTGFAPSEDANFIQAKDYFDFVLKLMIAIGIAFVLPVFLVLLNFVGVLSAASILKSWRIALLVIILFTAIATPSADVISMFLLAIPMVMLYFGAYGIAWLHDRRAARRAIRLESELAV